MDGVIGDEAGTGGGDHDGVDDELDVFVGGEDFGDFGDVCGGAEHSGFGGGEGEGLEEEAGLVFHHFYGDGFDAADEVGGFGDDGGDDGEAVEVEVLEGFEVRLEACTGGAIGASDGHDGGDGVFGGDHCFLIVGRGSVILPACRM